MIKYAYKMLKFWDCHCLTITNSDGRKFVKGDKVRSINGQGGRGKGCVLQLYKTEFIHIRLSIIRPIEK